MNQDDLIRLARDIYTLKAAAAPDFTWDFQKIARESFSMAMQFFLAVQAERAAGNIDSLVAGLYRSQPASSASTAPPGTSSSPGVPLQPGSTMGSSEGTADPDSIAERMLAAHHQRAQAAGTDSPSKQSQEQDASRGIQVQPFAPYDEHAT